MEVAKGSLLERQAYDYFRTRFTTVCREYNIPGSGNNWRYDFGVCFGGKDYLVEIDGGYHFLECGRTEGDLMNSNQRDSDKTILALERGFNVVRIHYEDMPEFISHFDKALASTHTLYLSRKEAYTYLFEHNKERYEAYMTSLLRRYAGELNDLFPSPSFSGKEFGSVLESTLTSITEERKAVATRQSNFLKNIVEENQRLKIEAQTAMQSLVVHLEEKKTYLEGIQVLNDEVEGMKVKTASLEEEKQTMLAKMQNLKRITRKLVREDKVADKRTLYLEFLKKASIDTSSECHLTFWKFDGEDHRGLTYNEFDEIVRTNPEATSDNVEFWKPYLFGAVLREMMQNADEDWKKEKADGDRWMKKADEDRRMQRAAKDVQKAKDPRMEKAANAAQKAAEKAERIAKAARVAQKGAAKRMKRAAKEAARKAEAKSEEGALTTQTL